MDAVKEYGLIFDVDGVIADSEAVNAEASIRMLAERFDLTGVRREDFKEGLGRGAAAYVRAAAGVHGRQLSDNEVAQATRERQENFLAILRDRPLPAFPGVLELMQAARQANNWRVAIATSSARAKSQAVLESACVPYQQMVYVTGSDITHRKPHPEVFLRATEGLKLEPSRCVVIEDAPNGIEAAREAGCASVAVTNSLPAGELGRADMIVASLESVDLDLLARLIDRRRP